jgi:hypothetical protein
MASLNACHRFTSLRVHQVTGTHLQRIDSYSAADQMVRKASASSPAPSAPAATSGSCASSPPATKANTWPNHRLRRHQIHGQTGHCGQARAHEPEQLRRRPMVVAYTLSLLNQDGNSALSYSVRRSDSTELPATSAK